MPDMPNLPGTTEEIEAIYASGSAATVALVQQLLELLATQQQTIMRLSQRVQELEDRLGRNSVASSDNSSQPPSADGFNRPSPRSLRRPTGKKPGGQPGHKGQTLRFSAHPDRVVEHRPQECAECGCPLDDVPSIPGASEARQVVDLPPMQLETTEHRAHAVRCPVCASRNRGVFPTEAADCVQYGPHIKALGLYLMSYQLVPYERTGELFAELFGSAPSEGTLHRAQHRASCELVEVEEAVRGAIRQAEVAHFDDTGMYIEGKREWLHVASTRHLTLYQVHPKRGEGGTRAMGVLPGFEGVA